VLLGAFLLWSCEEEEEKVDADADAVDLVDLVDTTEQTETIEDTDSADESDVEDLALLQPLEGVATQIELKAYSDGWGTLLETRTLDTEGSVSFDIFEEQPYTDPPSYYVYARAEGFFTEIYRAGKAVPFDVDLDAVPPATQGVAGVLIGTQSYFADCVVPNQELRLEGPNGYVGILSTDANGRFAVDGLPLGQFVVRFDYQGMPIQLALVNAAGMDYQDLVFNEPMQAAAPNLYLYPEQATQVSVQLGFPQGGAVILSEPEYGDGWSVWVEPDGIIEQDYGYLFYEASLPEQFQTEEGWVLDGGALEAELRRLLGELGFVGREIDDFIAWWLPVLPPAAVYAVYPQDAASLVTLQISPAPQSLMRALFLIRPLPAPPVLREAPIAPFVRDGFTAVEWGVLVL
jgi:hypothetical protein